MASEMPNSSLLSIDADFDGSVVPDSEEQFAVESCLSPELDVRKQGFRKSPDLLAVSPSSAPLTHQPSFSLSCAPSFCSCPSVTGSLLQRRSKKRKLVVGRCSGLKSEKSPSGCGFVGKSSRTSVLRSGPPSPDSPHAKYPASLDPEKAPEWMKKYAPESIEKWRKLFPVFWKDL